VVPPDFVEEVGDIGVRQLLQPSPAARLGEAEEGMNVPVLLSAVEIRKPDGEPSDTPVVILMTEHVLPPVSFIRLSARTA